MKAPSFRRIVYYTQMYMFWMYAAIYIGMFIAGAMAVRSLSRAGTNVELSGVDLVSIFVHNSTVLIGLSIFAFVTAGYGNLVVYAIFGLLSGGVFGVASKVFGIWDVMLATTVHGVLESYAFFWASSQIAQCGFKWWTHNGGITMRLPVREVSKVVIRGLVLLLFAAFLEANLSPRIVDALRH